MDANEEMMLGHVLPGATTLDLADHPPANAVLFGELRPVELGPSNLTDIVVGEFGRVYLLAATPTPMRRWVTAAKRSSVRRPVSAVRLWRVPSQIRQAIVAAVAIPVTTMRSGRSEPDERLEDEPVDGPCRRYAVVIDPDVEVPALVDRRAESSGHASSKAPDVSEAADFVAIRSENWSPNFSFHACTQ